MKLAENDIMEEKKMKSLSLCKVCVIFGIVAVVAMIVDYLFLYPNFFFWVFM